MGYKDKEKQKENKRLYSLKNKDKNNERSRLWYKNNKDTKRKQWILNNKDKKRSYYLKSKYNITVEVQNQMLLEQSNKCAICKNEFTKTPCVDHNHETGEVRGLLCDDCNKAFGFLKENITIMNNMIDYAMKWNNNV